MSRLSTATYDGGDVVAYFGATIRSFTTGWAEHTYSEDVAEDIKLLDLCVLGVDLRPEEIDALPERLRKAIMDKADDVDFE